MQANDKSVGVLLMTLGIVAAALILWGGLVFYVWVEPILDAFLMRVLGVVFLLGIVAVLVGTAWFSFTLARSEWRQRALLAQSRIDLSSHECAAWTPQLRLWPVVVVLCSLTVASLLIAVLPISTYAFYTGLRWLVFGTALGLGWFWLRAGMESLYGSGEFALVLLAIMVLWNPIFPVQLLKGIWIVLDYVAAMVLLSIGLRLDGVVAAVRRRIAIDSGVA